VRKVAAATCSIRGRRTGVSGPGLEKSGREAEEAEEAWATSSARGDSGAGAAEGGAAAAKAGERPERDGRRKKKKGGCFLNSAVPGPSSFLLYICTSLELGVGCGACIGTERWKVLTWEEGEEGDHPPREGEQVPPREVWARGRLALLTMHLAVVAVRMRDG
jgi:hypothetical protein